MKTEAKVTQRSFYFLWAVIAVGTAIMLTRPYGQTVLKSAGTRGISPAQFKAGMSKCNARHFSSAQPKPKNRSRNPRFDVGFETPARPVLIRNATLIDGDGSKQHNVNIIMHNGLFERVGQFEMDTFEGKVINLQGHFVTPGIVI